MTAVPIDRKFWMETAAGLVLAVKVQPGARRIQLGPVMEVPAMAGWPVARLKVSVTAPPEAGRANEAVIGALAAWLGIKAGRITLEAGASGRDKRLLVAGGSASAFAAPFERVSQAE